MPFFYLIFTSNELCDLTRCDWVLRCQADQPEKAEKEDTHEHLNGLLDTLEGSKVEGLVKQKKGFLEECGWSEIDQIFFKGEIR